MAFPNVVQDINDLQAFQQNLINLIYPVGSIYMSMNNISPATFLGGTWEQIKDRFLLSAGSKEVGSTGGEESHTLSVAETPAHTHTRGTMNITGSLGGTRTHIGATSSVIQDWCSGAIYTNIRNGAYTTMQTVSFTSTTQATGDGVCLDASKNWTGATSSVGGNQPHNNMPPYLTVYMWKRIS